MTVRGTSVKSTASAQGILKIGDSVTFTVALNRPVEVSGVPMLITSEGDLAVHVPGLSANPIESRIRTRNAPRPRTASHASFARMKAS